LSVYFIRVSFKEEQRKYGDVLCLPCSVNFCKNFLA